MALSNRHSGLERRHLLLTEWRFNVCSKETTVRKLVSNFEGDPTVGSKVMALSNRYNGLE
jgi:ABC-type phosphonate transport system ATPase subunit